MDHRRRLGPRQRLLLGDIGRPAIGGGDRGVELAMRVVEPGRALVVGTGQGASFETVGAQSRVLGTAMKRDYDRRAGG